MRCEERMLFVIHFSCTDYLVWDPDSGGAIRVGALPAVSSLKVLLQAEFNLEQVLATLLAPNDKRISKGLSEHADDLVPVVGPRV